MATINALAHWFGSNRLLAKHVGRALEGCSWVGVPFAGGMSELLTIGARTIVVNDLHRHVVNLARVAAEPELRRELKRRLDATLFHDDELRAAQAVCRARQPDPPPAPPDIELAAAYFKSVWLNRANKAGAEDEFNGRLCVRWSANGGDSAIRFRRAVKSLVNWRAILRRCTFLSLDAFEWFAKVKDTPATGLYCDPPFPGPGRRYRHNCGRTDAEERAWHERLATTLRGFRQARIVCRFYDHPLIRELYSDWEWQRFKGRDQANNSKAEVLAINQKPTRGVFGG